MKTIYCGDSMCVEDSVKQSLAEGILPTTLFLLDLVSGSGNAFKAKEQDPVFLPPSFLGSQMSFQNRLIGRSDFSADLDGGDQ